MDKSKGIPLHWLMLAGFAIGAPELADDAAPADESGAVAELVAAEPEPAPPEPSPQPPWGAQAGADENLFEAQAQIVEEPFSPRTIGAEVERETIVEPFDEVREGVELLEHRRFEDGTVFLRYRVDR